MSVTMNHDERETFLADVHVGVLSVAPHGARAVDGAHLVQLCARGCGERDHGPRIGQGAAHRRRRSVQPVCPDRRRHRTST